MSAIIVAGNEIIPDTLTVTVDGTEITAKDFQKVLLNINQASATASVADGTDLMQKMEIINKNANACDVSFKGKGGATVKNLKQNQSMRMTWTGSFWYVTFGGLLSGVAVGGTSFNYTTEVTLDEAPVNTVYSTTETDTGMTWIDGKKIYRQVFQGTPTTSSVGTYMDIYRCNFGNVGISEIIRFGGWHTIKHGGNSPYYYAMGSSSIVQASGCGCEFTDAVFLSGTNLLVDVRCNKTSPGWTCTYVTLILEYTKTTD